MRSRLIDAAPWLAMALLALLVLVGREIVAERRPVGDDATSLQRESSVRRHAFRPATTDAPEVVAAIDRADAAHPAPSGPLRAASVLGLLVWLGAAFTWIWTSRDRAGQRKPGAVRTAVVGVAGYVVWLAAIAIM